MTGSLPGILITLTIGAALAYVNYILTKKAASKSSGALSAVPVLRMVLNVGYLAAVYFIAPLTPWDTVWMLLGAVVGITVPMFIFTFMLLGQLNGEKKQDKADGENKGGDS